MSVRVLREAAAGAAYLSHEAPTAGEHFFIGRVRRTTKTTFLTCYLCDAVTTIPRTDANADHREVEALIAAGKVTPVVVADDAAVDPLQAAKDDGLISALTPIPQDTAGRKALRDTLAPVHVNKRPAGTRFQKRVGTVVEVHEDNGAGVTTVKEQYDVDAQGRMAKRAQIVALEPV